jgi:hypothetical protein
MTLKAEDEGVKHINTYSRSRTQLGRNLSNFARTPFNHPKYGKFNSVEGAWFWWKTGKLHDRLKLMSGNRAKEEGSKLIPRSWRGQEITTDEFIQFIKECLQCKLRENTHILMELIATDLPLEHYYVVGDHILNKPKYKWIWDEIERIRTVTQKWYIEKHGELPNIPIVFVK